MLLSLGIKTIIAESHFSNLRILKEKCISLTDSSHQVYDFNRNCFNGLCGSSKKLDFVLHRSFTSNNNLLTWFFS